MPDWHEEMIKLFKDHIGKGEMAGTAYDTAWVASIPDPESPDRPAFPQALEWLRLHQNSDGSWGAEIEYYHDRVLSTLIACIVLAEWRPDEMADFQIEAGLRSIWRGLGGLSRAPNETIGFELILPTLLDRARALHFTLPYGFFDRYQAMRQAKMAMIPPELVYSRYVTSIFSLEFLGEEADHGRLTEGDLQESNGSIATSPSATSYFYRKTGNPRAMNYIRDVARQARGAIPAVVPIDVFEPAWALYNVYLVENGLNGRFASYKDRLEKNLSSEGAGWNSYFSVRDLDDTSIVFFVLSQLGKQPQAEVLRRFEMDEHFYCYPYERDPSISAHAHLLHALNQCKSYPKRERAIKKAIGFLARSQIAGCFWMDKWHASAYYPTTRVAMATLDLAPELARDTFHWLLQTQFENGSWGYYGVGTAEETAYCVQALACYHRSGCKVPRDVFRRAVSYLQGSPERRNCKYRPLWLGKTMYSPTWVVHSAVLGALAMCQQIL